MEAFRHAGQSVKSPLESVQLQFNLLGDNVAHGTQRGAEQQSTQLTLHAASIPAPAEQIS